MFGSIPTVPIRDIAHDLHVSIAAASLILTAMSISFGAFMPLGGWAGNRFGRLIALTGNTPNSYMYSGEQYDPNLANLGLYNLRGGTTAIDGEVVGQRPLSAARGGRNQIGGSLQPPGLQSFNSFAK